MCLFFRFLFDELVNLIERLDGSAKRDPRVLTHREVAVPAVVAPGEGADLHVEAERLPVLVHAVLELRGADTFQECLSGGFRATRNHESQSQNDQDTHNVFPKNFREGFPLKINQPSIYF